MSDCPKCPGERLASRVVSGLVGAGKALVGADPCPPQERRVRRLVCNECPEARRGRRTLWAVLCSVCGCLIRFKTSLASQSCPRGHWRAVRLTVSGGPRA